MTLVFGAVCGYYVFHASDRLTTITSTVKNRDNTWDIHANKTVIVCGQGSWLVIGYTGLAYLDGKPTDEFIASILAGGADLSGGMGMWFPGRPLHYREMTRSIEQAMFDAYQRLPPKTRSHPTTISGVGVQDKKPRARHVSFRAVVGQNGIRHQELGFRHQSRYTFQTIPIGSVDDSVFQKMRGRLRNEGLESPEKFRDIMMDAVAETGRQSSVVGEDVMGVILEPLSGKIRVHFRSADPASQTELAMLATDNEETADIPNVSTPYILAPGQFFSPAVATGGWSLFPSGVQIELTGFNTRQPPGPQRAYWATHPRRTQP